MTEAGSDPRSTTKRTALDLPALKRCPECVAEGKRSTIRPTHWYSTLAYAAPFWDEEGRFHEHDPNTYTTNYECSEGHRWEEKTRRKCWCQEPSDVGSDPGK